MTVTQIKKSFVAALLLVSLVLANHLTAGDSVFPVNDVRKASHENALANYRGNRGTIALIDYAGNFDKQIDGQANTAARQAVISEFYQFHADEFDFLMVFTDFNIDMDGASGFYSHIFNDISGIGQDLLDNRSFYGDSNRLMGSIDLGWMRAMEFNPLEIGFDSSLAIASHELMHRWSSYIQFERIDGLVSDDLLGFQLGHWNRFLDSDASVMGGAQWQVNAEGSYTAIERNVGYSDLDLYLMGMLEPSEVGPIRLLLDSEIDPPSPYYPELNQLSTASVETISIEQIIAAEGERLPKAIDAQKEFTIGFILILRPNAPLDELQIVQLEGFRTQLQTHFAAVTHGKAVLKSSLTPISDAVTGTPTPVITPQAGVGGNNLNEALAWLITRRNGQGYWQDKNATRFRDTSLAHQALVLANASESERDISANWLSLADVSSIDSAVWLLQSGGLNEQAVEFNKNKLLAAARAEGWGINERFLENYYDTAIALDALLPFADLPADLMSRAIELLATTQNLDGGWSLYDGASSHLQVSARVLASLARAGDYPEIISAGQAFLLSAQQADGGFGDTSSSVMQTVAVLRALINSGNLGDAVQEGVAYLQQAQLTNYSWENSIASTAQALSFLLGNGKPNLNLNLTTGSALLVRGDLFTMDVLVSNTGFAATQSSQIDIYDGDPQSSGIVLQSLPISPLAAGQSRVLAVAIDTRELQGIHEFWVIADPQDLIEEWLETDNQASLQVDITEPPDMPDVLFYDRIQVNASSLSVLPIDISFELPIRNLGRLPTDDFEVALYQGEPGSAVLLSQTTTRLDGMSDSQIGINITIASLQSNQFYVHLDSNDQIQEFREDNNIQIIEIDFAASLDLKIDANDIQLLSPAVFGQLAEFDYTIHNLGTQRSPDFPLSITLIEGTERVLLSQDTLFLNGGQQLTRRFQWPVDRVGDLALEISIDPEDSIAENIETNNRAQFDFTSSFGGPDDQINLVLMSDSVSYSPQPGNRNQEIIVNVAVRNTGILDAPTFSVAIYDDIPQLGGAILGQQVLPAGLAASASQSLDFPITIDQPGNVRIYAKVDSLDQIAEFTEEDNVNFGDIELLDLPDLIVSASQTQLNPVVPIVGQNFQVQVAVRNIGEQLAEQVSVRVYEGDPGIDGVLVDELMIDNLGASQSSVVDFNWIFGLKEDTRNLFIQVDIDDTVYESNEFNNQLQLPITSINDAIYLSPPYISPNGDGIQEGTQLIADLGSLAAETVNIIDSASNIVYQFSNLGGVSQLDLFWDGRDPSGVVVDDGDYRFRILDSNNTSIAQRFLVVDTNRLPILEAAHTNREALIPLECDVAISSSIEPLFTADENELIAVGRRRDPATRQEIYALNLASDSIRTIIRDDFYTGILSDFQMTPDKSHLVVLFRGDSATQVWAVEIASQVKTYLGQINGPSTYQINHFLNGHEFVIDSRSSTYVMSWKNQHGPIELLRGADSDWFGGRRSQLVFNNQALLYFISQYGSTNADQFVMVWLDGTTDAEIIASTPINSIKYWAVSADGSRFVWLERKNPVGIPSFDTEVRESINVYDFINNTEQRLFEHPTADDIQFYTVGWKPNSNQLFVFNGRETQLELYDENYNQVQVLEFPTRLTEEHAFGVQESTSDFDVEGFSQLQWQSNGRFFSVLFQGKSFKEQFRSTDGGLEDPVEPWLQTQYYLVDSVNNSWQLIGDDRLNFPDDIFHHGQFNPISEWLPNDSGMLITDSNHSSGPSVLRVLLDTPFDGRILLRDSGLSRRWAEPRYAPSGTKLLLDNGISTGDDCGERGLGLYLSLQNMTARMVIDVDNNTGVVTVSGYAADKNFASYQLEVTQDDGSENWQSLHQPRTQEAIDSDMIQWTPTLSGPVLLRLSIEDLAGNTRSITERIYLPSDLPSPDVYGIGYSSDLISPNADGVLDQFDISYFVSAPINFTVQVSDQETGDVVWSQEITHIDTINQLSTIVFDGRDQLGQVLEDGDYVFRLLSFHKQFEIDTTGPEIDEFYSEIFSLNPLSRPKLIPRVSLSVRDTNLDYYQLESGLGDSPLFWTLEAVSQLNGTDNIEFDLNYMINRGFLLEAYDRAGNSSRSIIGPMDSQAMNLRLFNHDCGITGKPGKFNKNGNAVILPLTSSSSWLGTCSKEFTPQSISFVIAESYEGDIESVVLRYRLLDTESEEQLYFDWQELTLNVENLNDSFLRGHFPPSFELQAENLWVVQWDRTDNQIGFGQQIEIVLQTDVQSEIDVLPRLELSGVVEPSGDFGSGETDELLTVVFTQKTPLECNGEPSYQVYAQVSISPIFDVTEITGSIFDPVRNVYIDLFHHEFEVPGSGQIELVGDTRSLSTGIRQVTFVFSLSNGTEVEIMSEVLIDHQPSWVVLDIPNDGDTVCPIWKDEGIGRLPYLQVYGSTGDNRGNTCSMTLSYTAEPSAPRRYNAPICGKEPIINGLLLEAELPVLQKDPIPTLIEWQSSDLSGALVCAEREFTLDLFADVASFRVDNTLISPNGDNQFDRSVISFDVNEPIFYTVDIYQLDDDPGFDEFTSDNLIKQLPGVSTQAGAVSLSWDGTDQSGSVAVDGYYSINIRITDDCGNINTQNIVVAIDNTPPQLSLELPLDDLQTTLFEIMGAATDRYMQEFRLLIGEGANPFTFVEINRGEQSMAAPSILARWDTNGLTGVYTLLLEAQDQVANQSSLTRQVTFIESNLPLAAVHAQPYVFSPNQDQQIDTSQIIVNLSSQADIQLDINDASGGHQRALVIRQTALIGDFRVDWDGRNDAGVVLADGNYQVMIRVYDNALLVQEESLTVTIDNTPPDITLSSPQVVSQANESILVDINDLYLQDASIELRGRNFTRNLWQGSTRGQYLFDVLGELEEDDYAVYITAQDSAANQNTLLFDFSIDRTPPLAEIDIPEENSILSGLEAIVILGTASDRNFDNYRLELSSELSTDLLMSATQQVESDQLFNWLPSQPSGDYSLRLIALDQSGQESQDLHAITIDRDPPTVVFHQPDDGSLVGLQTEFIVSVNDANLVSYDLELAPVDQPDQWSRIISGSAPLNSEVIASGQIIPRDGRYHLRLSAIDVVGLEGSDQITIEVNRTPPANPLSLIAEARDDNESIALQWLAVSDDDLAGYRLYRHGRVVTNDLITQALYLDLALDEGTYPYTVTAIDTAGNESLPSNLATAILDQTPPEVSFQLPAASATVRATVDIILTAYSADDFSNYQLSVENQTQGSASELLVSSPIAVQAEQVAQLNTSGMAEDDQLVFLLEASDIYGNSSTASLSIMVDNLPPATPTGLVASETNYDVQLNWNPNSESDLAGYLIYRDGQMILSGGLNRPELIAIPDSNYLDKGLVDGLFVYQVQAVDTAGNLSGLSDPADVLIENRPPHAFFIEPDNAHQFESDLYILATSDDQDIARIEIDFKALDASVWSSLAIDLEAPYEASLQVVGLDYGLFQLRATATDASGNTDPSPQVIQIEYRDLTPPDGVVNLTAISKADTITLNWDSVADSDLLGYHVVRWLEGEAKQTLTVDPLSETQYLDQGLDDVIYFYEIISVDTFDNTATPSEQASAPVFSLQLQQPYTPRLESQLAITGTSPYPGNLFLQQISAQPLLDLGPFAVDLDFTVESLNLPLADSQIDAWLIDALGNQSRTASVPLRLSSVPSIPQGLSATVSGTDVIIDWDDNPESNIQGYRVFSDGVSLLDDEPALPLSVTVSSNDYTAGRVIDGDITSYWSPYSNRQVGATAEIQLQNESLIAEVVIIWRDQEHTPPKYRLQGLWQDVWVTLDESDDSLAFRRIQLEQAYVTSALRVVIDEGLIVNVQLAEVLVTQRPVVPESELATSFADGQYLVQVSAVNTDGFESTLTDPIQLDIGDIVAPEPVVLSGQLNLADALLTWTPSSAPDLERYQLYRDDQLLFEQVNLDNLSYTDPNLLNGSYTYYVIAVDAVGNLSELSNAVTLDVATVVTVLAPTNLTAAALPEGGAIQLTWESVVGAVDYRLSRSESDGGPYESLVTTASLNDLDSDLNSATRYYYVVEARDERGNLSEPSNQASAIVNDSLSPRAPILFIPTDSSMVFLTDQRLVDVGGSAEEGALVDLYSNGLLQARVPANSDYQLASKNYPRQIDGLVSQDGRFVFIASSSNEAIINLKTGDTVNLDSRNSKVQWLNGSDTLLQNDRNDRGVLRRMDRLSGEFETLVEIELIRFFRLAPDNQRLLIGGRRINQQGSVENAVWILDIETGSFSIVEGINESDIYETNTVWSSDSRYVTVFGYDGNYIFNLIDSDDLSYLEINSNSITHVDFTVDNTALIYSGNFNSNNQVVSFNIEDQIETQLDFGTDTASHSRLSPDGLVLSFHRSPMTYFVSWPALEALGEIDSSGSSRREWASDQQLLLLDYQDVYSITSPGFFQLDDMPQMLGINEIFAVAEDASGNRSPVSESIIIDRYSSSLPDLQITSQSFTQFPPSLEPGESLSMSLVISNLGESIDASALMRIILIDPAGGASEIANESFVVPESGGQILLRMDSPSLDDEGLYQIVVEVDANRRIEELDETNNTVFANAFVSSNQQLDLFMIADRSIFAASDLLSGVAQIFTPLSEFSGRLKVILEDANGNLISVVLEETVDRLETSQLHEFSVVYPADSLTAGGYQWHAELYDPFNQLITEQRSAFEIASFALFDLQIAGLAPVIASDASVSAVINSEFVTGNSPISNALLVTQIIDQSDSVQLESSQSLGSLHVGGQWSVPVAFDANLLEPADYRLRSTLSNGSLLATSEQLFRVENSQNQSVLVGNITLSSSQWALGASLTVDWQISNPSDLSYSDVPIQLQLSNQRTSQQVSVFDWQEDLPSSGDAQRRIDVDSDPLDTGYYVWSLFAQYDGGSTLLAVATVLVIDVEAPIISILDVENNDFVPASFNFRSDVVDLHSEVSGVDVQINDGPWTAMGQNFNTGYYRNWLSGLNDGELVVTVRAEDEWANQSISEPLTLIVDTQPPLITITGVPNVPVNQTVQPMITIVDDHLADQQILLNGQNFVSAALVEADGLYSLSVVATDLAGNRAFQSLQFEIDKTPPVLTVTDPINGYTTELTQIPVVGISEAQALIELTLATQTFTVNADAQGNFVLNDIPLQEGDNLLQLTASDALENRSDVVSITVNQGISQIELQGLFNNLPSEWPVTQLLSTEVDIINLGNVDLLQLPIRLRVIRNDGSLLIAEQQRTIDLETSATETELFEWDTTDWLLGNHSIELAAQLPPDNEWNILSASVITVVDRIPPDVSLLKPGEGEIVGPDLLIEVQAEDAHSGLSRVEFSLDNLLWQPMLAVDIDLGLFELQLKGLSQGAQPLWVRAIDQQDNQASPGATNVTVMLPPIDITIIDPPLHAQITESTVLVKGVSIPGAQISMSNGVYSSSVIVDGDGNFEIAQVPINEGDNPLLFTASNALGQEGGPLEWLVFGVVVGVGGMDALPIPTVHYYGLLLLILMISIISMIQFKKTTTIRKEKQL